MSPTAKVGATGAGEPAGGVSVGEECPRAAYSSLQGWCGVPRGEGRDSTSSCGPLREEREGMGRALLYLGMGPGL